MRPVRLIVVGGFLGAGKTTLLAEAARRLRGRGLRVGLITNDQGRDLVDTALLTGQDHPVREVSGGCFCCRFRCLLSTADELIESDQPDVILAEPVGSCTDLSATVLHPIKAHFAGRYRLGPLTVLAEPHRLRQYLGGDGALPANVLYVVGKQLEEADLVVVSKADLLEEGELAGLTDRLGSRLPGRETLAMSALDGGGVDKWLARVMGDAPAGQRVADVNYDTYAEGEAELGWLNADVRLRAEPPPGWREFCWTFLEALRADLAGVPAEIAHVKLLLTCAGGSLAGNLTSTSARAVVRGPEGLGASQADLVLNARVTADPRVLRAAVQNALVRAAGGKVRIEVVRLSSFRPARPEPTYRMAAPVQEQPDGQETAEP